jgi:hypothetical protein
MPNVKPVSGNVPYSSLCFCLLCLTFIRLNHASWSALQPGRERRASRCLPWISDQLLDHHSICESRHRSVTYPMLKRCLGWQLSTSGCVSGQHQESSIHSKAWSRRPQIFICKGIYRIRPSSFVVCTSRPHTLNSQPLNRVRLAEVTTA